MKYSSVFTLKQCLLSNWIKKLTLATVMIMGMGSLQSAIANCVRNVSSYTNVRSATNTFSDPVGKLFVSQPAPFIHAVHSGQRIDNSTSWYQITFSRNTRRFVHSSKIARTTTNGVDETDATVSLSSSSSYLNVRSGPGTCHARRSSLRHGTRVKVTGLTPPFYDHSPQGIWAELRDASTGRYIGYVANRFLRYP